MTSIVIKPVMDRIQAAFTYISAVITAIGGFMSLSNIALVVGILVTLALGLVQWQVWSNRKKQDKERHHWAKVQHDLRVKQMQAAIQLGQDFDAGVQLVDQLGAGDPADQG
ncbi:HP1 family phage holin [Rheinheimera aquimaris]|uniref:HP1 family phage holin n=1 Tax=Rheinheimera aquimaris TaxID=412437 RepID=UPI003A985E0B